MPIDRSGASDGGVAPWRLSTALASQRPISSSDKFCTSGTPRMTNNIRLNILSDKPQKRPPLGRAAGVVLDGIRQSDDGPSSPKPGAMPCSSQSDDVQLGTRV